MSELPRLLCSTIRRIETMSDGGVNTYLNPSLLDLLLMAYFMSSVAMAITCSIDLWGPLGTIDVTYIYITCRAVTTKPCYALLHMEISVAFHLNICMHHVPVIKHMLITQHCF